MVGSDITQKPWVRTLVGLLSSALSAALLTLAFPPYDLWPQIWVGFVPMLLAQHRLMPPRLSSLAPAVAIGSWLGGFMLPISANMGTYMQWLSRVIAGLVLLASSGERAFHSRTGYRWFVFHGALGRVSSAWWTGSFEQAKSTILIYHICISAQTGDETIRIMLPLWHATDQCVRLFYPHRHNFLSPRVEKSCSPLHLPVRASRAATWSL